MAALFLAAKVEETPKRLRDVCNVFNRLDQRDNNKPLEPLDIEKVVLSIKIKY
jgi:hypothetical protein